MRTNSVASNGSSIIDRDAVHALGVLVPIRFHPVKVLPGRHPLGRPGDGMRLLRTRAYVPGEDNPRDIDKFSPPDDLQVQEWEDEAQASITLLVDTSASMKTELKAPLKCACVLQLIYSLWRAGDRVGLALFDARLQREVRAANLRAQIAQTLDALRQPGFGPAKDISSVLNEFVRHDRRRHSNLLFVLSDFVMPDEREFHPEVEWRDAINEVQRNIVPVIISFELGDDIEGVVKLTDPQRSSRRMIRFTRERVARINREERQRVAALAKKFRSAGLDCMRVANQREIFPQLTRLARVRRQRKN